MNPGLSIMYGSRAYCVCQNCGMQSLYDAALLMCLCDRRAASAFSNRDPAVLICPGCRMGAVVADTWAALAERIASEIDYWRMKQSCEAGNVDAAELNSSGGNTDGAPTAPRS